MTSNVFKFILLGVAALASGILIGVSVNLMQTARSTANRSLGIIESYNVDDLGYVQNEVDGFVTGARMKEIIYHYSGYMPYAYITENSTVIDSPACSSTEERHTHLQPFYSYNGCSITSSDNYISDSDTFYFIADEENGSPFLLFVQDSLTTHLFVECDYNTALAEMNKVALQISNAKNVTNEKYAYNVMLDALQTESVAELKQLSKNGEARDVQYWMNNTTAFKTKFDILLDTNSSYYNYRRW